MVGATSCARCRARSALIARLTLFPLCRAFWVKLRGFPSLTPLLKVTLVHAGRKHLLAQLWSLQGESAFVKLTVYNDIVPKLPGMDGEFPLNNWQDGFRKAIMRLVEAQILSLEGHAV